MMFQKTHVIKDVWFQPTINNFYLFIVDFNTKTLVLYDIETFNKKQIDIKLSSLEIINQFVFLNNFQFFDTQKLKVSNSLKIQLNKNERASVCLIDGENIVFKLLNEELEKVNYVFSDMNLKEFIILKIFIKNPVKVSFGKILSNINNELICYIVRDSVELWQLNISTICKYVDKSNQQECSGKIDDLIVVDENHLIISAYQYGIMCVLLNKGEILWKIPEIKNSVIFESKIYSFSDFFYEIDAVSGNVLRKEEYKTLFNDNNFKTYWLTKPVVSDNIICITSHYDNAILIIDRVNFAVLQRINLGKCSNGVPLGNTPQIFEGKLYQLDGDRTLHIFEIM
jgi:hypothetical protein